ncbi:MAG: DUF4164 family protein [Alphaproteobacteria bacterium]
MTSFDSASQRLEKSLDRLESAVAARVARVEIAAAEQNRAAANAAQSTTNAAEARAASLAEANRDVTRRLDDTIDRITRLLES